MTKWERIKSDPVRHAAYKARELARVNRDRKAYNAKKAAWVQSTREAYNARKREHYAKNKEHFHAKQKRYRSSLTMEKKDYRRLQHRAWCQQNRQKRRESIAKCHRKRSMEDPERYKKYRRNKYIRNRAYYLKQTDEYRRAHPEVSKKAARNRYLKNKNNPAWKFQNKIRSSIGHALRRFKAGKISKSAKTETLIGCSFEELKARLEAQFLPGMTWDNFRRHGWHVDHIHPVSRYNLSDPKQQRECFHYSNLQPMWARKNLQKYNHVQEYSI